MMNNTKNLLVVLSLVFSSFASAVVLPKAAAMPQEPKPEVVNPHHNTLQSLGRSLAVRRWDEITTAFKPDQPSTYYSDFEKAFTSNPATSANSNSKALKTDGYRLGTKYRKFFADKMSPKDQQIFLDAFLQTGNRVNEHLIALHDMEQVRLDAEYKYLEAYRKDRLSEDTKVARNKAFIAEQAQKRLIKRLEKLRESASMKDFRSQKYRLAQRTDIRGPLKNTAAVAGVAAGVGALGFAFFQPKNATAIPTQPQQ